VLQRIEKVEKRKEYLRRDWESYKAGFGKIEEDFFIGFDNMFALSNQRLYSIRYEAKAVDGEKRYALYDSFWIDDENNSYKMHKKGYSGNA
ncbi:techylectin-5A, partial [Nephila pilipes]